jgi:broad specificity phosphatase PhoE
MKIILLRHVESESNKGNKADSQIDSELTEEGREKAKKLIPQLKKLKIDVIIVSPLKRTLDTIKPFLESLKSKPKIIVGKLTSERDLGKFTGSKIGDFQEYCNKNNLDKVFQKPEGGESIFDTYKRAKKLFSSLKKNYKRKNILICGHKNFLLCLEIVITNKRIEKYYSYPPLKTGEIKELKLNE